MVLDRKCARVMSPYDMLLLATIMNNPAVRRGLVEKSTGVDFYPLPPRAEAGLVVNANAPPARLPPLQHL